MPLTISVLIADMPATEEPMRNMRGRDLMLLEGSQHSHAPTGIGVVVEGQGDLFALARPPVDHGG